MPGTLGLTVVSRRKTAHSQIADADRSQLAGLLMSPRTWLVRAGIHSRTRISRSVRGSAGARRSRSRSGASRAAGRRPPGSRGQGVRRAPGPPAGAARAAGRSRPPPSSGRPARSGTGTRPGGIRPRVCAITPRPARAAAISPFRLPLVQAIRHARPCRSSTSSARARVMPGRRVDDQRHRAVRVEPQPLARRSTPAGPARPARRAASSGRRLASTRSSLPGGQPLVQGARQLDRQLQIDLGVVAAEPLQDLRQPGQHEVLRGAEAQPAAQPGAREERRRPLVRLQDRAREPEHRLAVLGQLHAVRVPGEQLPPAASSSLRTCWLTVDWRSPEPAGGLREAQRLGHREEGAQLGGVVHGSPFLATALGVGHPGGVHGGLSSGTAIARSHREPSSRTVVSNCHRESSLQ